MTTPPPDTFCPYKGLQPYTEGDRRYFFGRGRDQGIISSNLFAASVTVFYGASGVGKSSVLLAGVVPRLREEPRTAVVVVFNNWQADDFREALKGQIARDAGVSTVDIALPLDEFLAQTQRAVAMPMLIIFDQFEEYFLYHPPSPNADSFEAAFARAINRRDVRVNFLLSLREDGLSKLDRFQGRIPTLLNNLLRLEHLDRKAAEEAITKPLDEYNVESGSGHAPMTIEPGLVNAVLDDLTKARVTPELAGQGEVSESQKAPSTPIETPFMQMVLTRLWDQERANGSQQLRLKTYEELGRAINIARTHLDNMMAKLSGPQLDTAAKLLRYLVTPTGSKIAQESSALASWSEVPEAEVQEFLTRLTAPDMRILKTVQTPGQPVRYEIFHDVLAPAILDWRARYVQEQKRLEAERLAAAERAKAAEQLAAQHRKAKRARWIAVGMFLLLIVMVFLAYKAFRAKFTAHSHELAAYSKSQLDTDPELGMLLAIEAVKTKGTPHSVSALRSALLQSHVAVVVSDTKRNRMAGVGFSPDGKYFVTASWNSLGHIWETQTGKSVSELSGHKGHVNAASFSPDGKYVLTAGEDGTARIWSDWNGSPRVTRTISEPNELVTAAFSPDGQYILTGGGEGKVRVWEWKNEPPTIKAELSVVPSLMAVVEAGTESAIAAQPAPESLAPVPYDATPTPTPTPATGPVRGLLIFKAVFSPDGKTILIAAKHRRGLIWSWTDGPDQVVRLSGHQFSLYDVAYSPDGKFAITSSDDSTALVWELHTTGGPTLRAPINLVPNRIRGVAFSPDGKFVATASYDKIARLWEWRNWQPKIRSKQKPEERSQPIELRGHAGLLISVAYSRDGQFVVTGSDDGTARVWRTQKLDEKVVNNLAVPDLLTLAQSRVTRELTPAEREKFTNQ